MNEIEDLRLHISELRDRMAETAQILTKISGRLFSKEMLNQSEYDETLEVISGLKAVQSDFCKKLLKLSGNNTMPNDLDKAELMISEAEDKLNKAPLREILSKLNRITVSEKAPSIIGEQLQEIINETARKCASDIRVSDMSSEIAPYERLINAMKSDDIGQRSFLLAEIRSRFPAELINSVIFGDLKYGNNSSTDNIETFAKNMPKLSTDAERTANVDVNVNIPEAAENRTESDNSPAPIPLTLEQEDICLPDKKKMTDSDEVRLKKLKACGIKIGVVKCPFKYELNKGDKTPTTLKRAKKDLEKYSNANLRAAMCFCKNSIRIPEDLDNRFDDALNSLVGLGYLNSLTRDGISPIYFVSAKGKKAFSEMQWFRKEELARLKSAASFALDNDFFDECVCAENNIMVAIGLTALKSKIQKVLGKNNCDESIFRMGGTIYTVVRPSKMPEDNYFLLSFTAASEESALRILNRTDQYLSQNNFSTVMLAAYDFAECDKLTAFFKECYPENKIRTLVCYSISENKFKTKEFDSGNQLENADNQPNNAEKQPKSVKVKIPEKETIPVSEKTFTKESAIKGNFDEETVKFNILEKAEKTIPVDLDVSNDVVRDNLMKMIGNNKIYCACAYLLTLSKNNPENKYYSAYAKLAYAVNDPAFECRWSSLSVMGVFEKMDETLDGMEGDLYLSAALRMLFYNQAQTDYDYQKLSGMVKATADSVATEINVLINELIDFRKKANGKGIDAYANYRIGKQLEFEKNIKTVIAKAAECQKKYFLTTKGENIAHKRFLMTKQLMVDHNSDLAICLNIVVEDNRDMIEMVEDFLDKNEFSSDENKTPKQSIGKYIDFYWGKAAEFVNVKQKSSKLISNARSNLVSLLENSLNAIRSWVYYTRNLSDDNLAGKFEKEKKSIAVAIENAITACEKFYDNNNDHAGTLCVLRTLRELRSRMDGSYSVADNDMFYVDFLQYEKVMLDENYLPYNDNDCAVFLDGFSLSDRIIAHSELPIRDLEERLAEIFGEGMTDDTQLNEDYGCARLIISYLESQDKKCKWNIEIVEYSIPYASARIDEQHTSFNGTLELAQSYGRIDDIITKEAMKSKEDLMYHKTLMSKNFGHYKRFLSACEDSINKGANKREEILEKKIAALKNDNSNSNDDRIKKLLSKAESNLKIQNYTAAEDMLNRIERNDLDDYSVDFYTSDSFTSFLNDFKDIYEILKPDKRGGAINFKPLYSPAKSKEERAANDLISNFPLNGLTNENKIQALLDLLSFKCKNVEEKIIASISKTKIFDVCVELPHNNTKQNYLHPISPFGSFAVTNGFRVVCLFGKYSPEDLINKFRMLGEVKHCIVLLDYSLNLTDRREFARMMKKEAFSNIFILVDPIVIRFLAKHYSAASINRMLMEVTMPFSFYQPYVSNPSQPLPIEMFMGRRHQLSNVKSPNGANIVYGGRQLGKTALLQMAKTEVDKNENHDRAVYITAKGMDSEKTALHLSERLVDEKILPDGSETNNWEQLCRSIDKRLRDESHPTHFLLVLIDEADTFIESCKAIDYDPLTKLEELQINGCGASRFKFVVAGLRNVVRFEKEKAQSNNSVLARLQSLNIAPLTAGEARELLEIPLRYLGIRFPEDKLYLISNILASTNYFPGLIHSYCAKLVEAMKENSYAGYNAADTPPYYINENHIKKVLADPKFNEDVIQKLNITLRLDEDNYYYIIAHIIAFCVYNENETGDGANGFTAEHIYNVGMEYEVKKFGALTPSKIGALMDEMCQLNVLTFNKQLKTYSFARHSFIQLLGKPSEIEQTILSFSEV